MDIKEARQKGFYVEIGDEAGRIHSKYNPRREARRRLPDQPVDHGRYVVAGAGLGYVLDELIALDPNAETLVLEPRPRLLSEGEQRDVWSPDQFDNYHLITPQTSDYVTEIGSFLTAENQADVELVPWTGYQERHPDFFRETLEAISRVQSIHRESIKVLHDQGPIWLRNMRRNLSLLKSQVIPTPNSLDQDICLVSAGPSLDHQMDWLKENRDSLLVVSGNTAGPILDKHDVRVDVHVAVDANEPVVDDLRHSRVNHLMISPFVDPEVGNNGNTATTMLGVQTPLTEWLRTADFLPPVYPGGAISATMLNWFASKTTKRIFLLGCDMAFRFGRYYARGTHREDHALDRLNRFNSLPHWHLKKYRESNGEDSLENERDWFVEQSRDNERLAVPTCPPSWWEGNLEDQPLSDHNTQLSVTRPDPETVNQWFAQQYDQLDQLLAGRKASKAWTTFQYWVEEISEQPQEELEAWRDTMESLMK